MPAAMGRPMRVRWRGWQLDTGALRISNIHRRLQRWKKQNHMQASCVTTFDIWRPPPTALKEIAPRLSSCCATSTSRCRSRSSSEDVVDVYGNALTAQGKTQEAIAFLERIGNRCRASVELALGKCYLRPEHPDKGMEILKHLYFTMPTSAEAAEAAALADGERLRAGRQLQRREDPGRFAGKGGAAKQLLAGRGA